MEVFLYDLNGIACNRNCPSVSNIPHFDTAILIRNNVCSFLADASELNLGDVILSASPQKNLTDRAKEMYCGIVAFSNVHQSRACNISVSKIINDVLLLNTVPDTKIKIYASNDFNMLLNGLTILSNLSYIENIVCDINTKKFNIEVC